MANDILRQTEAILRVLVEHSEGLSRGEIESFLSFPINSKTLQRRLASLVDGGQVFMSGDRKAARYHVLEVSNETVKGQVSGVDTCIFGSQSRMILKFLETPLYMRERVSYNRNFLDSYLPNKSRYIPTQISEDLYKKGRRFDKQLAAGTYARNICQRLLIDLSYNSSRLEGNTYSRLDTQKLVEEGVSADGKVHEETVMIMNHKEAILFLVENAQDIELNSLTIRNLHHLLSQDLLANPESCGNIRTIEVDISRSTYKPMGNRYVLKELLELILQKAKRIDDPFEQSFFLLVQLSYLQAFEDVNKRTSRLACNIPFIRENLCPLSFTDIAREDYTAAVLTMYELNNIEPMLDLFIWAYSRSCDQYGVVKKSLGDVDIFRIQYRQQRKTIMGKIVKQGLHGKAAEAQIETYCQEEGIDNIEKFIAMTLTDLSALHAGAIIGLGITEAQLDAWLELKP